MSQDNEFLQTSIYADINDNFPAQPNPSITDTNHNNANTSKPATENTLPMKNKLSASVTTANPAMVRPRSSMIAKSAILSRNSASKSRNEIHSRNCHAPTALSIDVHNIKTINGPHSCLRTLLDLKSTTLSFEAPNKKNILVTSKSISNLGAEENLISNSNVKGKILRKIYYRSAWYDVPPGSSKRRFKSRWRPMLRVNSFVLVY